MRQRPPIATLLAISVMLASVVNFAVMYVVTSRPREIIHAAVQQAESKGEATTIPRPAMSLDEALHKGDIAVIKQHMYWCLKEGSCDLEKNLRQAAAAGNSTAAKVLLAAGAKVNGTDRQQETALHTAAAGGGAAVARVLLQAGADANAHDEDGLTPLHSAVAWGHVELTRVLLAAGAQVNAADKDEQTPLHLVAARRVPPLSVYASVARMLLEAGARPNARSADGSTPLRLAKLSASRLSLDGNVKAAGDAREVAELIRQRGGHE